MNTFPEDTKNNPEALGHYLSSKGLKPAFVDILLREAATGATLPDFSQQDFAEIGINEMGQRKLLGLIIKDHTTINEKQNMTSTSEEQSDSTGTQSLALPKEDPPNPLTPVLLSNTSPSTRMDVAIQPKKSVDVKGWVEEIDLGLSQKLSSKNWSDKDRRRAVQIAVAAMIKEWGSDRYPSAEYKEKVAKGIVAAYPNLKSTIPGRSYESFFDPKSGEGYLVHRLRTVRTKLTESQKMRKRKSASEDKKGKKKGPQLGGDVLPNETLLEKVSEMKNRKASDSTKSIIRELLAETRSNRAQEIKGDNTLSATAVLYKYPHLKSFEGEMIDEEFRFFFEKHDVFLAKFPAFYAPRIVKLCEEIAPDRLEYLEELDMAADVSMKALLVLPDLLPQPNYSKAKRQAKKSKDGNAKSPETANQAKAGTSKERHRRFQLPHPCLLRHIPANEDVMEASKPLPGQKQPFLVSTARKKESKAPYFIRLESLMFSVGRNGLAAFDRLFKIHYLLDVEYASPLLNFYNFMESCVYEGLAPPLASSDCFLTRLNNIDISENNMNTLESEVDMTNVEQIPSQLMEDDLSNDSFLTR